MLCLTRRKGEEILIGDDILVKVFQQEGDFLRIGIEAPASISVHRREIYNRLPRETGKPTISFAKKARVKPLH